MLFSEVFKLLVVVCLRVYNVRVIGLEPTRLSAPDPKSGAAANYATPATVAFLLSGAKIRSFPDFTSKRVKKVTF